MEEVCGLNAAVDLDGATMLAMVSMIQLAMRHPELARAHQVTRDLAHAGARKLQAEIEGKVPGMHEVMEAGWNPQFDVSEEEADDSGVIAPGGRRRDVDEGS
jgi:hypothetical protein